VSIPEIKEREDALAHLREHGGDGITPAQVEAAIAAAEDDRTGGYSGRTLGFGVILARPLYEGGDWQEFVVAVTDGTRHAQMVVRLSRTAAAQFDDVAARWEHVRERLQGATASLRNDGRRYENVLLYHPLGFGA
jgi:hypothetical protein